MKIDMDRLLSICRGYARLGDGMQRQLEHLIDGSANAGNINENAFRYIRPWIEEVIATFDGEDIADTAEDVFIAMEEIEESGFDDEWDEDGDW